MKYSKIVLLEKKHRKEAFDCGKPLLDNYIKTQVGQDSKRNLTVCFVIVNDADEVKAYYTLSNYSIQQEEIPEEYAKRLPKSYIRIPVTLLGRLAVDRELKGNGYGEFLLIDALRRALEISKSALGSMAVVVDPLDDDAKKFYEKYGFTMLPDSGKMFLAMTKIEKAFGE
ncbi:Predicted acyltransferase [Aquiflexum balticum DSM 16537]|jgi:predicted GNAT family N-acyltransferase|uniref:Predicted acyltransferase n=1 Tax=Aquiflexum balticum DSM 16537 TaxID=758820 RepID=A0A1W2H157_9BACT|nr:GNAT family N-acetyltransferase [Aquiflexum balticum]SMD42484.1 Predicted acyltransferase [Aquiflexum balticum DSM 16537]